MGGVRQQWVAKVLEQVPDHNVAWAEVEGATNAGAVTFAPVCSTQTKVLFEMEFEPEGFLETVADKLHIVENQAEHDLENFKRFIESGGLRDRRVARLRQTGCNDPDAASLAQPLTTTSS